MRRHLLLSALGVLAFTAPPPAQPAPTIEHQQARCVVAERFPRLEARFTPPDMVAKARVLFLGQDGRHWYAVAMRPEGPGFSGVLPKPKKSLESFRYYIEVVDQAAGVGRTEEYTTKVVGVPGECQDGIVTSGVTSASVAVEVPSGAPSIPAGFSGSGVAVASGAAGAAVAASAGGAAAAGAGGLSTAAVVGLSAVAVGGAAVAVTASKGEEGEEPPPPAPPPSPAVGNYVLVSLDGANLPTVVLTTPCIGSAVSGTLRLDHGDPPRYELTQTTSFQCANGPGPTNPHTDGGRWSESGGTVTFIDSNVFRLSTGTFNGTTLTMPMDILSEQMGVPARRYQSVWAKR